MSSCISILICRILYKFRCLTLIHVQVGKQLLSPSLLFTHCFFNSENYTIRIVNKGHTLYQSRRARYVALRGCLGRDRVIDVFTPTNTTSGYHH